MIKFFRHIRRSLINQNKMGKYFKYAIGEIILVVLGILIALSINNWNENRKVENFETKTLTEIKSSMEQDLARTELIYKYRALPKQKAISNVIEILSVKESFTDSLLLINIENAGKTLSFYFDKGPFESLKSKGLDIIRNDSLRTAVIRFYEVGLPLDIIFLDYDDDVYRRRKIELQSKILDQEFVKQDSIWRVNRTIDYKKIKQNKEIKKWLGLEQKVSDNYIRRLESIIDKYKQMIAMVAKELNKQQDD